VLKVVFPLKTAEPKNNAKADETERQINALIRCLSDSKKSYYSITDVMQFSLQRVLHAA
jgi:hypothetical protein